MSEKIFYSEYFYDKVSKDTDALEKNVHDYPFSSLANFLLLYHYKKINHPDFGKHAKKAALLFNNPYWLEFQLSSVSHNGTGSFEKNAGNNEVSNGEEILAETKNQYHPAEEPITADNNSSHNMEGLPVGGPAAEGSPSNTNEKNISDQARVSETSPENTLTIEESPKQDDLISFEPLHTVDYFASQGIKLNEEALKQDKLVNQVKSFTAWLKSMKRIHPAQPDEQNVAGEKLVQATAEESNVNTEVLTEAMAEVLIKQDKKEKAIEMFTKLSLINPSKSAYFASRIENIKSTL